MCVCVLMFVHVSVGVSARVHAGVRACMCKYLHRYLCI